MELRNVKTFIKVAELGNFSRAASEMGYAQSTVTMQIRQLEEELKVTLFERHGKRITLSNAGREFLDYAYDLQRCESMAIAHFSSDEEPAGSLKVGVMETICASYYAEIFTEYMKRYPGVSLKTVVATTLECMEKLEKGQLDVIITVDRQVNRPYWETYHEIPSEICFFCSTRHPFAGRTVVSLEELVEETFIQIEEGCNYREDFERYLEEKDRFILRQMEIGYTRMIIDAVIDNRGVSLLPKFTLENDLRARKIALFSVPGYSSPMSMQVIYSKNRWLTPALQAFLDMTREFLR